MTNVYFRMIEPEKDQHEPYTKSNKHNSEQTERKNWWKADDLTSNHQKKNNRILQAFPEHRQFTNVIYLFWFFVQKIFPKKEKTGKITNKKSFM